MNPSDHDFLKDDLFADQAPSGWRRGWQRLRRWRPRLRGRVLWVIIIILVLYYPVGMILVHRIDDNLTFKAPPTPAGGSEAISMAAALIEREVDGHGWPANDPFFLPGAALDNMPNYQKGMMAALARFAVEMTDQIGRTRGSSQADPDLEASAGLLKYPGDVWVWDPSVSFWPTASSEDQYRAAARALVRYNQRLVQGKAVFERRADNLQTTLERIAADLGSASAVLEQHVDGKAGGWIDFQADDVFYNTKGRLYAYRMILDGLGRDYANVIRERDMGPVWQQMIDSFSAAADLQPWIVMNASPNAMIFPNHLATQGFYLLRARTQLREVSNVLLK